MPSFPHLNIIDLIRNPSSHLGKKEWPGLYRGMVEEIMDPELRGRLKVRVNGVHPDSSAVPVEHLHWAEPLYGDSGLNYGDFHVPYRVGDWVYVMFLGGHPDYPIWFGSWYGMPRGTGIAETPEEVRTQQYPHRRIIKTRRGHKIELSDELGDLEIKITDVKGNYIWLDTEEDKLKLYWQGSAEWIITQDFTVCVDRDFKVKVGRDHLTEVDRHRSAKVDGTETVGVGQNMYHYTGGSIYHNQGGSATPVSRLPDPSYTVQQRKPSFPDRTATLARVSQAVGVPPSSINQILSTVTAVSSRGGASAESVQSGLEMIGPEIKKRKDVGTAPTIITNASTAMNNSKTSLLNARKDFNKAATEINRLYKQGAPVSTDMMNNMRSIADRGKTVSDYMDGTTADFATAQASLSLVPPDINASSEALEAIRLNQGLASVETDKMRQDLLSLRNDLNSVQSGRELNISGGLVQTQTKRYNIEIARGYIDDTLADLNDSQGYLDYSTDGVDSCRNIVGEQVSNTVSTTNLTLGGIAPMLDQLLPDEVGQIFQLLTMILDVAQEPSITSLLNYISTDMGGITYPQIRTALIDTPDTVIGSLSGIMNGVRYNDYGTLSDELDYGFGGLSNIDDVATTHGFGPPLLATIATLKTADVSSISSVSGTLISASLPSLKNLSDALLLVGEGHMGRIYDIANDMSVPGMQDTIDRVSAMNSGTLVERASTSIGQYVPRTTVISVANELATRASSAGGYPQDDPVIRLPAGVRSTGLIE